MTDRPRPLALVDEGLGNSSYLVDLGDRRALVLDASRDPAPYLAAAERKGLAIAYAAETHLHADFVSGSRELAAGGAQVLAAAGERLEFPHRGLDHGEEVDLGGLTFRALATPGHTPEHLAYLLLDGRRPLALFSGGSLLVGAVARTDLIDPTQTEELARALWRSLHEQILTLPDDLPVYPTHGAGSFCSAPSGGERTTTIGREKSSNPLLGAKDEDDFLRLLFGRLGTFPPYFLKLREVNQRGPRLYGPAPDILGDLEVDEVRRLVADGAQIVDARPVEAFAAGHIPGSLSIELRDSFATWLGWLTEIDTPLVFVLDGWQDRVEVARQALKIGYERLAGELAGGLAAWQAAGQPVRHIDLVPAGEIDAAADGVLDVRQADEYEAGHVPGARHIELGSVRDAASEPHGASRDAASEARRLSSGVVERNGRPLTIMCASGPRAMSAASILETHGLDHVRVAIGGAHDWAVARRRPLETGS